MTKLELSEIFYRLAIVMERVETPDEALNVVAAELMLEHYREEEQRDRQKTEQARRRS